MVTGADGEQPVSSDRVHRTGAGDGGWDQVGGGGAERARTRTLDRLLWPMVDDPYACGTKPNGLTAVRSVRSDAGTGKR